MTEIYVPCLVDPKKECPEDCKNHKFAVEFRDSVVSTLGANLNETPSEQLVRTSFSQIPFESGRVPILVKPEKILLHCIHGLPSGISILVPSNTEI